METRVFLFGLEDGDGRDDAEKDDAASAEAENDAAVESSAA